MYFAIVDVKFLCKSFMKVFDCITYISMFYLILTSVNERIYWSLIFFKFIGLSFNSFNLCLLYFKWCFYLHTNIDSLNFSAVFDDFTIIKIFHLALYKICLHIYFIMTGISLNMSTFFYQVFLYHNFPFYYNLFFYLMCISDNQNILIFLIFIFILVR